VILFKKKISIKIAAFPSEEKAVNVLSWLGNLLPEIKTNIDLYLDYFKNKKTKNSEFHKKKSEYSRLCYLERHTS
jgi:hypothetical protein